MADVGDILRFTHFYTLLGEECLNVFFYEITSANLTPVLLPAFIDEYEAGFNTGIMQYLSASVVLNKIKIENLTDGVEFTEKNFARAGGLGTDVASSSLAYTFLLSRGTKVTRNGFKRFPGVLESELSGNTINKNGVQVAAMQDYLRLGLDIQDYNGASADVFLTPRIVGRTKDVNGIYQIDLNKVNNITGAALRTIVGTQNTRKP